MTIKEFEALDINAKANLVWEGKFVGSRVVDDVFIQRYKLTGFEVDVYYDPTTNKITCIETSTPSWLSLASKGKAPKRFILRYMVLLDL